MLDTMDWHCGQCGNLNWCVRASTLSNGSTALAVHACARARDFAGHDGMNATDASSKSHGVFH